MTNHRQLHQAYRMATLMSLLLIFAPNLLAQSDQTAKAGTKTTGKNQTPAAGSSAKGPSDAIHDVMSISFTSQDACKLLETANDEKNLKSTIDIINQNEPLESWSTSQLAEAIKRECPDCKNAITGAADTKKSDVAYIFHVVTWTKSSNNPPNNSAVTVPISSDWHVYQQDGKDILRFTGISSDGSPRIYNKKNVLLVGIDRFKADTDSGTIVDAYRTSVTQGTPQNQTDLAALMSALLGISGGGKAQAQIPGAPPPFECQVVFIAAAFEAGTAGLPFDAKVTVVSDDHYSATHGGATPGVKGPHTTGNITTSGPSCDLSTTCVGLRLPSGATSLSVQATVKGDFSGTLDFEVSPDSKSFVQPKGIVPPNPGASVSTTGTWTIDTSGMQAVRVRGDTLTTGAASVELQTSSMPAASPSEPTDKNGTGKGQSSAEPAPGVMTCTGSGNSLPCTTTRTFTSNDREWWDVSIGITVPGVREAKYSIVNSALKSSVTLHTDLYAMLDLYPFAYAAPKDDWEPHFNLGVPITSQSLYRPYVGMAESVGGFLSRLFRPDRQIGLPVGLNVFAGVIWMKTQTVSGNPTTSSALAADLHNTHLWRPVFGVEVPISSIASKIKGVGSKNTNGGGKGTNSSTSSN